MPTIMCEDDVQESSASPTALSNILEARAINHTFPKARGRGESFVSVRMWSQKIKKNPDNKGLNKWGLFFSCNDILEILDAGSLGPVPLPEAAKTDLVLLVIK